MNEPNLSNPDELLEFNLWEERWINCCKELNQWSELSEYASTKENDLSLSLDCSWKQQQQQTTDWSQMKSLLIAQKEASVPRDQSWRLTLYHGYYLVCNPDDYQSLTINSAGDNSFSASNALDTKIERCMHMALKEWRRLPRLVSPAHMTLLQAAQQIVELQEAFQIQNNLNTLGQLNQTGNNNANLNPTILQEIKAVIKRWRARLPLISDDISYWNDIFTWRQFHFEAFTKFYDKQQILSSGSDGVNTGADPAMLCVHALAQGIISLW